MDNKCICSGNLRNIVSESEHLLGKKFSHNNNLYVFFGIVYGEDDLYYGMSSCYDDKCLLLTCVCSLDTHEFEEVT